MSLEFLLNQSPFSHLGVWSYGVACCFFGVLVGYLLRYKIDEIRSKHSSLKENPRGKK